MKQALHGAIHVKRCYCSADFAVKNLAFLKTHSIRPMVNATAGKNCTDIALAIDAVQLCEREVPAVVVIIGSDSDFAPLVMHLRDRGCRVEGVGQEGKVGAESHLAYDDFSPLPWVGAGGEGAGRAAPRRPGRAPAAAPAKARLPVVPGDVERWLDAVPGSRPAKASSSRSPPRRCARRSCCRATPRRRRCSRSIRTGSS
jgi:hypothetical protein